MRSRKLWLVAAGLAVAVTAALVSYRLMHTAEPHTMRHPLTGYVLEVMPATKTVTVRNEDMPGVMQSMVMVYRVKDPAVLSQIKPGDTIQAIMVNDDSYWLEDVKVTGKR